MDLDKLSLDDLKALRNNNLDGMSLEGLQYLKSQRKAPEPEIKPDTGFTGALKSSAEQIQADWERLKGKVGVKSTEEAEAEAKKHEEKAAKVFKPTEEGWLEAPWTKLKETAGGSLPYMVAPVAAGAAVGAAPVAGALGLGATTAAMLGAGAASATQFTGAGLSRQVEAGKSLEDTSLLKAAAASIPQAALDVVGLKYIPGIQKIFRSVGQEITEKAAKEMLEQGTLRTAGQYIAGGAKIAGIEGATEAGQAFFDRLQAGLNIADPEARKEYLDNFIGGAALSAVASPFGVRGTRSEARGVLDKAQAKRDKETLAAEELAKQQAAETAAAQKEMMGMAPKGPTEVDVAREEAEAHQMSQEISNQRGILTREMERLATAAQNETDHGKLLEISNQAQQLQKQLDGIDPDNISKQIEATKKQDTAINKQIKAAEKAGDKETVAQLKTHLDNNASIRSDFEKTLRALKVEQQSTETAASIDKKIQAKQTALEKAKESGDVVSIGKIINDIQALKSQRPGFYETEGTTQQKQFGFGTLNQPEAGQLRSTASGTQASLFEGEGESAFYPEYQKRLAEDERQLKARGQEVIDQEALQEEIQKSTGAAQAVPELNQKYNDAVAALREKLAEGYEKTKGAAPEEFLSDKELAEINVLKKNVETAKAELEKTLPKTKPTKEQKPDEFMMDMLAHKLVDMHTRPDTHIPSTLTPAQKAAETKRVKVIDEAKEEFKQKLSTYLQLVNEADELGRGEVGRGTEVYTARGDIAALGKRVEAARKELAIAQDNVVKAIPEGTKTVVESGRASAIAQDIHLLDLTDTIDSMRKGEWFGGPNAKMAQGFLPALANKARSALDKYIQATVTNINYARLAKGMDRLNETEKADIVNQIDTLMNGKIQRAIGKKATALKEAEIGSGYMKAALEKAGFRFKEQEILTGFHRNEYKDVQRDIQKLKIKYTNAPGKEIGKIQKVTPEAASQYASQKALTQRQAAKNKAAEKPTPVKTDKEITEAREKTAAQQTGLGLAGKKQTFETAEKLQASLPHQGPKVQAAFNFAKQYFKEWNAKKSMTMNEKQRLALKEARQKYKESRIKLAEQFKNSRVHPRIAKIMNWMVTADEKTARYRKAENLIIGLEEKMQQQVFAKTPKKQIESIAPAKKEEREALTEKEQQLKEDLGYKVDEKESPEEVVGRISEMGLAKMRQTMQKRVDFITNRLEKQKAPVKDREGLAKEKDKLLKQIKATDEVLSARRLGAFPVYASKGKEAAKGVKELKPGKHVRAEAMEATRATPSLETFGEVVNAYEENLKNQAKNVEFNKQIGILAAIELRLERNINLTAKRKKELEKKKSQLRNELKIERELPSAEEEAAELGIKDVEAYKRLLSAMNINFQPRVSERVSAGIRMLQSAAQSVVDAAKLPKGLKVFVVQDLSPTMKQIARDNGHNPDHVKGFVTEDGHVVIVAGAHKTSGEVAETLAHEITGHLGVENLLGPDGMKALVKKISTQKGGVIGLADKLGVGEEAQAAYDAAIAAKKSEDEALEAAVHEMIAHTAEKYPSKDWVSKANEFIKALVGAVRTALRKIGINLDTSTSDIYKLLREARRDFKEVTPGAYKSANGNIQFSSKPSYNSKFKDLGDDVGRIVHANKDNIDKVKAAAAGFKTPSNIIKEGGILSPENRLALRTRYIDRFAPVEKVAEKLTAKLGTALEGTQLMYYLRMFDQGINWVAQTASHGPMSIIEKKRKDGKVERIIETKEGASLLKVSQALKEADVGDANAANQLFTFYLAAKRAKNKGLNKLNFSENVTQEMLDKVMDRIESDAKTANAFQKAADIYNEYNRGLIEFGVQTGRFSKKEAADLMKENDYVPFYRINKSNGNVTLDIGGADPVHIGNVKDQPYLKELAGGDEAILDVFTSALQNTRMLTDMALRNLATRNVAFSLQQLGGLKINVTRKGEKFGSGIYPDGKQAMGPDVIRFKIDGVDHYATVDTDAMGIPADLLVKGLDGVQVSIPNLVKVAGYPAKWLRSFITRNPAYAVRQIARDSLSNAFTTGSDALPIIDNLKHLGSMLKNTDEGEMLLKRRGVLGGQVLGNAPDAMQKAMLQIIDGKPGWEKAMAYLDHVAMMGDASSRVTSYNSFVKQGLSDMEATLASLEAMNFSKKGTSPSLYLLNHMVPFLNAQIQGMDVLYKAFAGKMPFADKLDIKSKIWKRGAMMAAFTMAYTAMSYDDDDYKNATPAERIGNWFIKVPGIDEKVKVPIPFEVGGIFKMLPEMIYSTAFKDKKLGDAASEISKYAVDNFMPSFTPTAIKPIIELGANHSFFTGKPIESQRLMELAPGLRSYANTPEALKALGEATNISPVKMEYLIRTFTGSLPLAILSLANPIGAVERPEGRGALSSTTPVIGAFFQPKDANGLIDKAYQEMNDVIQAKRTYENLVESGREEEADEFLTKEADLIGMATFAGKFRKQMGDLAKQERQIRSMTDISGAEKRQLLDEIKQAKIEIAKEFASARE